MIKVSIADLEALVAYLKRSSGAFGVHIKLDDLMLIASTVDMSGQVLEVQVFDMDRSKSKAKVVQITGLDVALKAGKL